MIPGLRSASDRVVTWAGAIRIFRPASIDTDPLRPRPKDWHRQLGHRPISVVRLNTVRPPCHLRLTVLHLTVLRLTVLRLTVPRLMRRTRAGIPSTRRIQATIVRHRGRWKRKFTRLPQDPGTNRITHIHPFMLRISPTDHHTIMMQLHTDSDRRVFLTPPIPVRLCILKNTNSDGSRASTQAGHALTATTLHVTAVLATIARRHRGRAGQLTTV